MPCLSGDFNPAIGVIVQVVVVPGGQLGTIKSQQQGAGNQQLTVNAPTANGLMDTGADATCISEKLAKALNLKPTGKVQTVGVHGPEQVNQHSVDLLLQFGAHAIGIPNLRVSEFKGISPNYDLLIGRDVICQGVLTMTFNGRFTFSI